VNLNWLTGLCWQEGIELAQDGEKQQDYVATFRIK
jgi:hypothetical protein